MKKRLFVLAVALAWCTTATAIEIAISTQAGWFGQGAADTEMAKIVANVKAVPVKLFPATDQRALADWVRNHTGDGAADLLILCGQIPDTIYAAGNTQANNSLAELFLDDGNCIVNTGDYMFYVVNGAGTNAEGGIRTIMDNTSITMWDDDTAVVVTADGKKYTPTLKDFATDRPFHLNELQGDWYPELIMAQNAAGTRADPVIVRNRATGGRLGIFYQTAGQDTDPRGQVMSEWINNWYLARVAPATLSANPSPADKATDVPRDTVLGWKATAYAGSHDVYLGTTLADVNTASRTNAKGVLASKGQADATFDPPGSLAYGRTYYWRVDEVNKTPDSTIYQGGVWSFTVEPYGYPIKPTKATASSAQAGMGPEKTIDGSGLTGDLHGTVETTMWLSAGTSPTWIQYEFDKVYKLHDLQVWNSNQMLETFMGFGAKKVTIETSTDGTTWKALASVPEFARASGTPDYAANTTVSFGGVEAKFVKLTIAANWGGLAPQTGLSEVRFTYVPVQARVPQPANAAAGVTTDATLSWRPGREAGSHKVFLGTDRAAVTGGTVPTQTVTEHSFAPAALNLATTYYWRVDEVNTVTYPGDVWSFTTETFKAVDDFESYTDKTGQEVYATWVDGFDNPAKNGAVVGLPTAVSGTFCDTTSFHGGAASMPVAYDNSKASLSEAVRTFTPAQDWTASGIKSLSLWFRGATGNGGQLYVKINDTKILYDGDAGDLARSVWQVWNIDLAKAGKVNAVRTLAIGVEGGGAKGSLNIDDVRLYPKTPEYIVPVQPAATGLIAYYMFDEGTGTAVKDSSGVGNNGTFGGAPKWVAGYKGGALQLNGSTSDYVVMDAVAKSMPANNNFSISAWIKTQGTSGYVVSANDASGGHAFWMGPASNGNLQVQADTTRNYPPKINDNQWHMITYVRDGTTAYVYVDGLLVGTETPTASPATQTRWSIGQEWDPPNPSDFYTGLVDEVRFYARPLSAGEVAGLAGLTKTMAKPF